MEWRPLEVYNVSVKDLKDVNVTGQVDVVFSLSDDLFHNDGSTNCNHTVSFTVDEAAVRACRLTLKFQMKAKTAGNEDVGRVDVNVRELLEQGGEGKPKSMSCSVRLGSGKTNGVLEFCYKFGEKFTVATPRAANVVDKPGMAYPSAAAMPPLSSAAAFVPPMHGAAPYPSPEGYGYQRNVYVYPPPGYGHPPQAHGYPLAGFGNTVPPGAYSPTGYGNPPNTGPVYGPVYVYPPQGYGHPPAGYGHPPAGYGHTVPPQTYQNPPIKAGGNFARFLVDTLQCTLLIGGLISGIGVGF